MIAEHQGTPSGAAFEMMQRVTSRIVQATGEDLPWQVTLLVRRRLEGRL